MNLSCQSPMLGLVPIQVEQIGDIKITTKMSGYLLTSHQLSKHIAWIP